jgi:hypothetical protein
LSENLKLPKTIFFFSNFENVKKSETPEVSMMKHDLVNLNIDFFEKSGANYATAIVQNRAVSC